MSHDSLDKLKSDLRTFYEARKWDQFHSPKNLSMALIAEAANEKVELNKEKYPASVVHGNSKKHDEY